MAKSVAPTDVAQPSLPRETQEPVFRDGTGQATEGKVSTVDIVIPAFNEERCIADVLRDVLASRQSNGFEIQNIYVISDASTDRTEELVQQMAVNNPKIKLIRKQERKGKQHSINLALSMMEADIAVFIDADVRLGSEESIEKLISHFSDSNVAVVQGGLVRTHPGFSLDPAKLAAYFDWLVVNKVRRQKPISWWSIDGRVMALSRDFYKHLVLPSSLADDQFIFYSCVQQGRRFVWAQDAVFYYGPPESVSDFSHQWSRYFFYTKKSREYFGKELIDNDMRITGLWRIIVSCLLRHPVCGFMWLVCYGVSIIERLLKVDFLNYERGLFWTKSSSLRVRPSKVNSS